MNDVQDMSEVSPLVAAQQEDSIGSSLLTVMHLDGVDVGVMKIPLKSGKRCTRTSKHLKSKATVEDRY